MLVLRKALWRLDQRQLDLWLLAYRGAEAIRTILADYSVSSVSSSIAAADVALKTSTLPRSG